VRFCLNSLGSDEHVLSQLRQVIAVRIEVLSDLRKRHKSCNARRLRCSGWTVLHGGRTAEQRTARVQSRAHRYFPAGTGTFLLGRLRKMKTWKKVLLGIVLFIVTVVALAMFLTSGLDKPVQHHFAALRAGDVIGAYSDLSIVARQQTSLDDFKAMLTNNPGLTHVTDESFSSRETNNGRVCLKEVSRSRAAANCRSRFVW